MADSDTPGRYLGAYGLCRDPSGRLLRARLTPGQTDEGHWTMPGGGVEWGEHPDATVLRELEEETAARTSAMSASPRSTPLSTNGARSVRTTRSMSLACFEVMPGSFDVRPERDGSTDRCEWFTEHQARKLPRVPIAQFAVDVAWPKP